MAIRIHVNLNYYMCFPTIHIKSYSIADINQIPNSVLIQTTYYKDDLTKIVATTKTLQSSSAKSNECDK